MEKVRDVVGPDFDINGEALGKPTPTTAMVFCDRVEENCPPCVEEAMQLDNEVLEEVRQIRTQTRLQLVSGERLT